MFPFAFFMGMTVGRHIHSYKRSFRMFRMRPRNANPVASPSAPSGAGPSRKQLPRLELLHSFEAAARHLSFTLAAKELFLTQSAVSRQIAQLEMDLGIALFTRHHRALALTEAGQIMQRAVTDCLDRLRDATVRVRGIPALRQVSITCTPGFASLWLIPRLSRFTSTHPQVDVRLSATLDVLDLARSGIDIAVRFCPKREDLGPSLFEETVLPLCAPALCNQGAHPLRTPADLSEHTLLTVDIPQGMALTVEWEPWLKIMGLSDVRLKNTLRFTQYTEAVAAAVAGQGVVIGRVPLLNALLQEGKLVAPFAGANGQGAASQRAYYIDMAAHARSNPDAQDFAQWLRNEVKLALG